MEGDTQQRGRPPGSKDSYQRKRRSKKVTKRLLELRKQHPKSLIEKPT